eukprot:CAMPEP_0182533880 /NCGR_PEP_ID=MMETSP1323-20130603/14574_1 /TAXON_ID=236787 /ORGANISM="Florenciella parvula, Strain RCC1693" /LENGTH=165 /DNA_ID=CAMNT_0024743823 /DNA_START=25 /DNA_END=523 /DNA_ORIENTATION=-
MARGNATAAGDHVHVPTLVRVLSRADAKIQRANHAATSGTLTVADGEIERRDTGFSQVTDATKPQLNRHRPPRPRPLALSPLVCPLDGTGRPPPVPVRVAALVSLSLTSLNLASLGSDLRLASPAFLFLRLFLHLFLQLFHCLCHHMPHKLTAVLRSLHINTLSD